MRGRVALSLELSCGDLLVGHGGQKFGLYEGPLPPYRRIRKRERKVNKKNKKTFTYRSITSLEPIQSLLRAGPRISRHNCLNDILHNLPQLIMLLLDQQNTSRSLGVERARNMQEGLLDDLLYLRIGDGRFLLQRVVGAARGEGCEKGLGVGRGGHLSGAS